MREICVAGKLDRFNAETRELLQRLCKEFVVPERCKLTLDALELRDPEWDKLLMDQAEKEKKKGKKKNGGGGGRRQSKDGVNEPLAERRMSSKGMESTIPSKTSTFTTITSSK